MLADRPRAVAALTKIFLTEIERLLLTASGGVTAGSPRGREPTASSSSRRPEFLSRLADLVPPPRKHRHRYHGMFVPNPKLRRAGKGLVRAGRQEHATHEPLITRAMLAEVPLAGLSLGRLRARQRGGVRSSGERNAGVS